MIAIVVFVLSVVCYRLAVPLWGGEAAVVLANFSPLAAMALCGGAFLPRRAAALATLFTFAVTDVALNVIHDRPVVNAFSLVLALALVISFVLGWRLRRGAAPAGGPGWLRLAGATVVGTLAFHVLTNTAAFAFDPGYPKSMAGWIQSLTVGLPQYSPPTWVFLLKSLAGNLFFTGLFVVLVRPSAVRMAPGDVMEGEPAPRGA